MGPLVDELRRREAAARAEADRLRARMQELADELVRAPPPRRPPPALILPSERRFRPRLADTVPGVASGIRYSPHYVHECTV